LKDIFAKTAEKHFKFTKELPMKPWINNQIIELIEKPMKVQKCD